MADLPFGPIQRAAPPGVAGPASLIPQGRCLSASRGEAPVTGTSGVDPVDRNRLGEFGAELVADGPFDDRIGALAAGQHQPYARADLKLRLGLGHEAALGDVEHPRFDAAGAKLAHLGLEADRNARRAA